MLYGTITEFCTPNDCKVMSAGAKYVPAVLHNVDWTWVCEVDRGRACAACACVRYEYHWSDGVQFKKPVRVSAPEYVDYLMTWVSLQLDDESIFPSRIGSVRRPLARVPAL